MFISPSIPFHLRCVLISCCCRGKDAASPRYIFTRLHPLTRKLFIPDDDLVLRYRDDDGLPVEPYYYTPVLPMVLINGAEGIGTGFSTFLPTFHPLDVVTNVRLCLRGMLTVFI